MIGRSVGLSGNKRLIRHCEQPRGLHVRLRRHAETSEPIPCPSLRAKRSNPGAAIRPSGLLAPRMLWPLDCFVTRAPRNDGWVAAHPIDSVVIGRRQAGLREYGTLRRLPAGLARPSSLGVSQRARQRRRAELSTPGRALGALALRSVRGFDGVRANLLQSRRHASERGVLGRSRRKTNGFPTTGIAAGGLHFLCSSPPHSPRPVK